VVTDSFISLAMLLSGSDLVAIVPQRFGRKLEDSAQIRLLPAPVALNEFHVAMIWPALFERDPAHRWLRGVMADLGKELLAG
jgi:DNA-binding transcriptional LysR family regulator